MKDFHFLFKSTLSVTTDFCFTLKWKLLFNMNKDLWGKYNLQLRLSALSFSVGKDHFTATKSNQEEETELGFMKNLTELIVRVMQNKQWHRKPC